MSQKVHALYYICRFIKKLGHWRPAEKYADNWDANKCTLMDRKKRNTQKHQDVVYFYQQKKLDRALRTIGLQN